MTDDGRTRLELLFSSARRKDRAVLLPYLTAGLPSPARSLALFEAMAEGGADGFEVGIPYSDPLMDGPTIHTAGLRALQAGATVEKSLEIVAEVGESTGLPVIVMTYVNPVLRYGPERFAAMVAEAGGTAVIVADLPAEEAAPFRAAFDAKGLGSVLFIAPTTDDDRLRQITHQKPAFLYGIAQLGVTGERDEASDMAAALAQRVREMSDIPLVLGVGITTPAHAALAALVADGVIVGSALVRRVLDADSPAEAATSLRDAVRDLAASMQRSVAG